MERRRWSRKGSPKTYVLMDLPMSLRCNGCGKYMYKGTVFRSRREKAEISPAGIQRYRFYLNCTGCSAEIAIKLYPHYPHFTVETGATRCDEEAGATRCACTRCVRTDKEAGATRSVSTDEEAGATRSVSTDEEASAQTSP